MAEQERILVTGATGQVGAALCHLIGSRAIAVDKEQCDLRDAASIRRLLDAAMPSLVIHPAAYTAVDQAESELELAHRINAGAAGDIAQWCAAVDVPMVHFSTDYVFDGSGTAPRTEDEPTGPLNVYGHSKLAGEEAVLAAGAKALIFRASWVYDSARRNFFTTILNRAQEKDLLQVVDDQWGAPTYGPHLAQAVLDGIMAALRMDVFPTGIYHLTGAGETSWHGFAQAIVAAGRAAGLPVVAKDVQPVPSSHWPAPAERPKNSRLSCAKARSVLGLSMPDWREGLAAAMKAYADNRQ